MGVVGGSVGIRSIDLDELDGDDEDQVSSLQLPLNSQLKEVLRGSPMGD